LSEIPGMVCSSTAVYHRIPGDMRNWPARPPASRKGTHTPHRSSPGARALTAPTEREPPTHRNFGAGANRNVVDKNVRIVSPQTHTMDVALHWRTRGAAMTPCTHTSKCKAFGHHAQTRIHAPGTIASTWEYLAGQQHRCCRLEASSDAAAAEISNVKFVLPTPRGKGRELELGSGQCRAVHAELGLGPAGSFLPQRSGMVSRETCCH